MKMHNLLSSLVLSVVLIFGFGFGSLGCGGGGSSSSSSEEGGAGASGGSGSALTVADQVSVVDAQSGDSSLSALRAGAKFAVSALPATSDYNTDETFVFVEERSAEAFDMVNEIFCMIGQSGYQEMVNLDDYQAQIDITQCTSDNDSASGKGESSNNESSGSNQPEYEFWTMNSYRADNDSPHIVAAWMHMPADEFEPAQVIEARTHVLEEPSESNPYGIMEMYFKAYMEGDLTQTTLFKGYIQTEEQADGSVALKFYDEGNFDMEGQTVSFGERVTIVRDGATISGNATVSEFDPSGQKTFDYQFSSNDSLFYRKAGTDAGETNVCLSRANFEETIHRYNIYETENGANPGARVERSSGVPVVYTDSNGERHHGYVGYWGGWFDGEEGPSHGDTVYQETFGGPDEETTETPYTFYKSEGKLKKHTLESVTLGEIASVPLSWHDCSEQGCTQYRVEWDKTQQKLYKTGTMNEENWIWENTTPEIVTFTSEDWSFNFWSESLNGDGMIQLTDPETGDLATLTNSTVVTFHREDVLYPTDTLPTSLICFEECPDPTKLTDSSPYYTASSWEAGDETFTRLAESIAPSSLVSGTHYVAYTFDADNMVLKQGSTEIVVSESGSGSEFGIWTGALIEPTPANLSALACDWDANATCAWEARNTLLVYYSYEAGANDWNKLTLLQNPTTLAFLEFEAPLMLEYINDDGIKYFVNYGGLGDLWGIPGKCVNDISEDVDCGDWSEDTPIRWVPEFSIPDGSELTDVATDTAYYTKAVDKEQRMIGVAESECTGAGLSFTDLTLPAESEWSEPNIGDEPTIDGAPAVIGGVLQ